MGTKVTRKIVKIDEEKCDGCGACVPGCAEGALQIIDGKAKLVSEVYCDGLGACLGECPQDAITIEEREASQFDEEAVEHHLHSQEHAHDTLACGCPSSTVQQFDKEEETLACGCPSSTVQQFDNKGEAPACGCPSTTVIEFDKCGLSGTVEPVARAQSMLSHWPVQLTLVPTKAPFLAGANVVLAADCVPFTYPNFHQDFLKGNALLVACPKLDDFEAHLAKLTEILKSSDIGSLKVVRMEVPCCSGLVQMAQEAIKCSGKSIPFAEVVVGVRGEVVS
ncbi:ATP-binding protein [Chloroflexota bacterium]